MVITFSKQFLATLGDRKGYAIDVEVIDVVDRVSVRDYRLTWEHDSPIGNLYAAITWFTPSRVRFTIKTRDAWKRGSRTAASGRHMRKASWEAHRDVMRELFKLDPCATIRTGFATYRGHNHFEQTFEATGQHNVGSSVHPRTIRECSI